MRTVADLLENWLAAEHDWKPSTGHGYRARVCRLHQSGLARRAPATVSPPVLRAAMRDWQAHGTPITSVALHVRTLKAAFGWAFDERLLAGHPLQGMHRPGQPEPRHDGQKEVVACGPGTDGTSADRVVRHRLLTGLLTEP